MASQMNGRIHARPDTRRNFRSSTTGLRHTGLDTERDGLLYVPESFQPNAASPLIVMLHGAGGHAHQSVDPFLELVDRTGAVLLAPESQGTTWDLLTGGFGADVYFINEALTDVFALYNIDPRRIAIAGFSDGASYALSLGAINGDLFTHIIAFSPGFAQPKTLRDSPPIFISHGTRDETLPIDRCSRKLVPRLQSAGLDVTYHEFDGGHTIPSEIGRRAFIWFLGSDAIRETRDAKVRGSEAGIEFT